MSGNLVTRLSSSCQLGCIKTSELVSGVHTSGKPSDSPASLAEGMSAKDESSSPTDPILALRPHILRRRDHTTFVILLPPPTTFGVAWTYRSGNLQCSQEVGVTSDTTYVLCRAGGP